MAISETKMQIVIANYFKDECDVNTSIRQAFEKGFRIGVKKGASTDRPQGEWIDQGWHGDWQFETDGRGNCWYEYKCSECGYIKRGGKSNYCPNCGADMRGINNVKD